MLRPMADAAVAANEKATAEALRKQLPSLGNIVAVDFLTATVRFRYRKRVFDIPPIPYLPGLQLQKVELELQRLGDSPPDEDEAGNKLVELRDMLVDMQRIMWRHVRPVTRFDKTFWRWRGNPFSDASRAEVAELLSFFLQCRTTSSVRLLEVKSRGSESLR